MQLAHTLSSPARSCDLLLFRLLDADEPSVYISLSRKDPVAIAAKAYATKHHVTLRVQYETSSDPVSALVQAAEHSQFVLAAWTFQGTHTHTHAYWHAYSLSTQHCPANSLRRCGGRSAR